jgi:hypothetical protein
VNRHERAVLLVIEALCAACVVASVVALAQAHYVWAVVFVVLAFGCYEAGNEAR